MLGPTHPSLFSLCTLLNSNPDTWKSLSPDPRLSKCCFPSRSHIKENNQAICCKSSVDTPSLSPRYSPPFSTLFCARQTDHYGNTPGSLALWLLIRLGGWGQQQEIRRWKKGEVRMHMYSLSSSSLHITGLPVSLSQGHGSRQVVLSLPYPFLLSLS